MTADLIDPEFREFLEDRKKAGFVAGHLDIGGAQNKGLITLVAAQLSSSVAASASVRATMMPGTRMMSS